MVDPDRVRRLLGALAAYRDHLAALRALPRERYVAEEAYTGRYLAQAAAQICIDLANHVISSEGWRVPADYRDAFSVLEENGVVAGDLAGRLRALAGLRNRLVHLYEDVDDALVHDALADGLDDLDAYARSITALLER